MTTRSGPAPWGAARSARRWGTFGVPVVVGALTVAGTAGAALGQPAARPIDVLAMVLLLTGPAALLARRRHPPVVVAVAAAAAGCYLAAGYPYGPVFLPAVVALGSAVLHGRRRTTYLVAAAAVVALLVLHLVRLGVAGVAASTSTWTALFAWVSGLAAVVAGCEWWRARRERGAQALRVREETQRRQGVEERLSIARELHDALGHHVSLINIQAGVALALFDRDPDQARTALAAIKGSSRELLGEMRSTLGVLRGVDEDPARAPVAGLDRLPLLVAEHRTAGLEVDLHLALHHGETDGDVVVPPSVEHAVFRIVQESLTNVRKHAGVTRAAVRIGTEGDRLIVEVTDPGRGPTAGSDEGRGLVGMRERAAALGGTLTTGRPADGGFGVRAELPLTHGTAADATGPASATPAGGRAP